MDKVSQSYWDSSYSEYKYSIANDQVTTWLNNNLKLTPGSAFEAGCFPGRYLAWLGKHGWNVSGMDLTPRMESDFRTWLTSENIRFTRIARGDVLNYMRTSSDRYDLVCSFGFIEHFENFLEVIALHGSILKPGGTLAITTPHFKGGVQKFLHSSLDRENLARHYLPSMDPNLWRHQLESNGFTIQWCGYFGNFDFWADKQHRNFFQKLVLKGLNIITPFLKWLPDSSLYSPYCGIIATKKSNTIIK